MKNNNIKNINDFLENCNDYLLTDDIYLEIKKSPSKKKIIITNIGLETEYDILIKYMDKKSVFIENKAIKRRNAIRRIKHIKKNKKKQE